VVGNNVSCENGLYSNSLPSMLMLDDEYLIKSHHEAFQQMRLAVHEAEHTLLICTTETTMLERFLRFLGRGSRNIPAKSLYQKIEIHMQNMGKFEGDQFQFEFNPTLSGANTKYNPMSAYKISTLVNEYRIPLVITTKHLASQLTPPKGFYDDLEDVSILSRYFVKNRFSALNFWWRTARGHNDGLESSPKGMFRSDLYKYYFSRTLSEEEFASKSRFDDMDPFADVELIPYDMTVALAAVYPALFECEFDSSGTFGIIGVRKNHGLKHYSGTLLLFKSALSLGFLKSNINDAKDLCDFNLKINASQTFRSIHFMDKSNADPNTFNSRDWLIASMMKLSVC
ncbi:MAG: hypothetical protein ACRCXZ_04185, partial [Patescibacteria group bacterium]